MHQLGGAADVFEAGPQFHHGQGAGGGDDRDGLVQGEGFGGPALLAFGGVGQGGDVAADQVVGFGVPDGALEREVPHRDRGGGVPGGHGGQRLPDVGGGQVAEFAGADDGQDGLEDVLVLRDGLGGAALEPVGEPVVGGLADGVVGVAGLGGDALVELGVQVAELVDDGGFGVAADFAAGAFPVAGVAEGEFAAPQARAVPVALGVAAGAAVFEGDAVFAAPAPGGHGDSIPVVGTISGDDGQPRPATPRPFRTRNS